ncbi:MAG: hypothetical protein M0Z63_10255, partial [Actinomycetota bacterium]|nr:hypothetical protein [Actinomycetota bacterium]
PGSLGHGALAAARAQVDGLLAAAAELGVTAGTYGSLAKPYAVDVTLPDRTRIVGEVPVRCPPPGPGPALVTCSAARPSQHLAAWLRLLALTATDPGAAWHSVVVRPRSASAGADTLDLVVRGTTSGERAAHALAGLEVAVDLWRRGRREPIPLFPKLSAALYAGGTGADVWTPRGGGGDGNDEATIIAFGQLSLDEVRALPIGVDDPPGTAHDRATRYADHLWSTVHTTAGGRT